MNTIGIYKLRYLPLGAHVCVCVERLNHDDAN